MGCYKLHTEDYFLPLRVVRGGTYKKIKVNARDIGAAEKMENGKKNYLLKDHLGNVRVVITEEQQQDVYPAATLEPALVATESGFYAIDQTKIVPNSAANYLRDVNNNPQTYQNNNLPLANNNPSCGNGNLCTIDNSANVYKLNGSVNNAGLGITLRVMAGDKIDVLGKSYYYQNNPTPNTPPINPVTILNILSGFLGGATGGAATSVHGTVTATDINTTDGTNIITNGLFTNQNNQTASTSKPRAFLNYIFFDDQFKAVASNASVVGDNKELKNHLQDLQGLVAPKNGFLYVYASNESTVDVFFDNVQVKHVRSSLLSEDHYYPFGERMFNICSAAAGKMEVKAKYNRMEFNNDLDLNKYDAKFRDYDPQTGRWWQIDPKVEEMYSWSTYASNYDNPIRYEDHLGDIPNGCPPNCGGTPGGYLLEGFRQMLQAGGSAIDKINPFRGGEVHNNTEAKVSVSGNLASGGSVETSATVTLTERSTSFTVGSFEELFKSGKGPIQFSSTNSTMTKLEQKNAFNTIIRGVPTELFQKTTVDKKSTMVSAGAKANTSSLLDKSKLEAGAELYYRNQPFGIGSGKSAGVKISADATVVVKQFQLQTPVINVKAVVQQKYGGSLFFGYNF